MAHPAYLKEKARDLRRRRRLTIDEIADRLAVSRTTIYYWVGDLPIPVTGAEKLAQRRAARANKRNAKKKRDEAYQRGLLSYQEHKGDRTFRDFICMYIGEGYKRCRNKVAICNSDPRVLKLAVRWMRPFVGNRLKFSLLYHADQNLTQLREFWAAELGIASSEIKVLRKSNSNQLAKRTWRSRYGVLTVAADDTMFRAELQAWMDEVQREWGLESDAIGA